MGDPPILDKTGCYKDHVQIVKFFIEVKYDELELNQNLFVA
jgi:hypothetical protein